MAPGKPLEAMSFEERLVWARDQREKVRAQKAEAGASEPAPIADNGSQPPHGLTPASPGETPVTAVPLQSAEPAPAPADPPSDPPEDTAPEPASAGPVPPEPAPAEPMPVYPNHPPSRFNPQPAPPPTVEAPRQPVTASPPPGGAPVTRSPQAKQPKYRYQKTKLGKSGRSIKLALRKSKKPKQTSSPRYLPEEQRDAPNPAEYPHADDYAALPQQIAPEPAYTPQPPARDQRPSRRSGLGEMLGMMVFGCILLAVAGYVLHSLLTIDATPAQAEPPERGAAAERFSDTGERSAAVRVPGTDRSTVPRAATRSIALRPSEPALRLARNAPTGMVQSVRPVSLVPPMELAPLAPADRPGIAPTRLVAVMEPASKAPILPSRLPQHGGIGPVSVTAGQAFSAPSDEDDLPAMTALVPVRPASFPKLSSEEPAEHGLFVRSINYSRRPMQRAPAVASQDL